MATKEGRPSSVQAKQLPPPPQRQHRHRHPPAGLLLVSSSSRVSTSTGARPARQPPGWWRADNTRRAAQQRRTTTVQQLLGGTTLHSAKPARCATDAATRLAAGWRRHSLSGRPNGCARQHHCRPSGLARGRAKLYGPGARGPVHRIGRSGQPVDCRQISISRRAICVVSRCFRSGKLCSKTHTHTIAHISQ